MASSLEPQQLKAGATAGGNAPTVQLQASSGGARAAGPTLIQPGMEPNPLCESLPVFDLGVFLSDPGSPEAARLCTALADCLRLSSALVVRDPRVDTSDNDGFLSLMERYFSQPTEAKLADVRADLAYQVGATPEGVEKPRCLRDPAILAHAASLAPADRPTTPTRADVKVWATCIQPIECSCWGHT